MPYILQDCRSESHSGTGLLEMAVHRIQISRQPKGMNVNQNSDNEVQSQATVS